VGRQRHQVDLALGAATARPRAAANRYPDTPSSTTTKIITSSMNNVGGNPSNPSIDNSVQMTPCAAATRAVTLSAYRLFESP
jgi:hypothetical protein